MRRFTAERTTVSAPEERIAIITDTCCDVPQHYADNHPIYTIPLTINYSDGSYLDRVNITPIEVYDRFETEIPTTSTPSPGRIHTAFEQAANDGYTHILAVTISSGLSSTHDLIRSVAAQFPQLKTEIIDTLNIGIGAGMSVIYATELMDAGVSFKELVTRTRAIVPETRIFFVPDTLEYLYKGGRISKAVYSLGSVLNLRPIFTCDEHGKYAVVAKARGRKKSIAKAIDLCQKQIAPDKPYRFVVAEGMAEAELAQVLEDAPKNFPDAVQVINAKQISPALVVHTGPGLIGFVIQRLD